MYGAATLAHRQFGLSPNIANCWFYQIPSAVTRLPDLHGRRTPRWRNDAIYERRNEPWR